MRGFKLCCAWFAVLVAGFCALQLEADDAAPARRARRPNPALAPIEDVPGLPRVLVIGDSISIGYTLPLRTLLKDKVNLHRIPQNGGPTTNGVANIDAWLGDKPWDVIHFNWGLHDLKYVDDKNQLVDPAKGHPQVSLEDYEKNLRSLVERLKKTGATLIWRNTTPVPDGSKGRIAGDELRYNAIAEKIMREHGVAIDDHHSRVSPRLAEFQLPENVHFKPEGSQFLAELAAQSILEQLPKK